MLRQDRIRRRFELRHERWLGRYINPPRPSRTCLGGDGTRNPTQREVSFHRGTADVEQTDDIRLGKAAVDRLENAFTQIKRVCFHANIILSGSIIMQTALVPMVSDAVEGEEQ